MKLLAALGLAALLSATAAQSTDLVLFETDTDVNSLNEVYLANYATHADFLTGNSNGSSQYLTFNVSDTFSVADFAYDGTYRMLFETDVDVNSLNELYVANYATQAAFQAGLPDGTSQYVGINVAPGYSVAGFTYDGVYRLLYESDSDVNGVNELYLANYATFADLLVGNIGAGSGYLATNVDASYSVTGLAYDGSYHLLFENNTDINGVTELYAAHYSTLADLLAGNTSPPTQYLPTNVATGFSTAGYEIISSPSGVPEPSSWAMMLVGFGAAGCSFRRRGKPASRAT